MGGKVFFLVELDAPSAGQSDMCTLSVTEVTLPDGESFLDFAYQTIGCSTVEVKCVTIDGKSVDIWCDEEYLSAHQNDKHWAVVFDMEHAHMPVFGSFLMAGSDQEGNTISVPIGHRDLQRSMEEGHVAVGLLRLSDFAQKARDGVVIH